MENDSPYKSPDAEVAGGGAETGDLMSAFLGPKNANYYLQKFDQIEGGSSISWHWPAFFVTLIWLGYRKMWGWFFAYWFLFPIIMYAVLLGLALVDPILGIVAYVAGYFVIPPLFANKLYYSSARKKIARAQLAGSDLHSQELEAARLGGTSMIAMILLPSCSCFSSAYSRRSRYPLTRTTRSARRYLKGSTCRAVPRRLSLNTSWTTAQHLTTTKRWVCPRPTRFAETTSNRSLSAMARSPSPTATRRTRFLREPSFTWYPATSAEALSGHAVHLILTPGICRPLVVERRKPALPGACRFGRPDHGRYRRGHGRVPRQSQCRVLPACFQEI